MHFEGERRRRFSSQCDRGDGWATAYSFVLEKQSTKPKPEHVHYQLGTTNNNIILPSSSSRWILRDVNNYNVRITTATHSFSALVGSSRQGLCVQDGLQFCANCHSMRILPFLSCFVNAWCYAQCKPGSGYSCQFVALGRPVWDGGRRCRPVWRPLVLVIIRSHISVWLDMSVCMDSIVVLVLVRCTQLYFN